jgi:hypothetical protein
MNASVTPQVGPVPDLLSCWTHYSGFAHELSEWFLVFALVVALIETALLMAGKIKALLAKPQAAPPADEKDLASTAVDPIKLVEALKGLLETLKGLPAWIAIFLAGLGLLFVAGYQPEACKPPPPSKASPSGQAPGSSDLRGGQTEPTPGTNKTS